MLSGGMGSLPLVVILALFGSESLPANFRTKENRDAEPGPE